MLKPMLIERLSLRATARLLEGCMGWLVPRVKELWHEAIEVLPLGRMGKAAVSLLYLEVVRQAMTCDWSNGQVLRATAAPGRKNSGTCLVGAWAQERCLVLGQQRMGGKSDEKTAIPALLEGPDLGGAAASVDAIAP